MSIASSFPGLLSIVDCTLGTPLYTGNALCAMVLPLRLPVDHEDILPRTDLHTDTTAVAGLPHQVVPVLLFEALREDPVVQHEQGGGLFRIR